MPKPQTVTTERLALRPLAISHKEALHAIHAREDAMRFMEQPPHKRLEDTERFLRNLISGGGTYWAITFKESETAIGLVGFMGHIPIPGLGYILHPDHWGQGYGTEAVRAAVGYGFTVEEMERVEFWINRENAASRRLAEKVGLQVYGRLRQKYAHNEHSHEMVIYGISRAHWEGLPGADENPSAYSVQPVLNMPDVRQAAEYYREVLGFRVDFLYGEPPDHAGVSLGEWTTQSARVQFSQGDLPPDPGFFYLYILVAHIDELHARMKASGAQILRAPQSYPWGMREFEVQDRYGYRLRFAESG